MEWTSEGVIVSVRKYGENSVIIDTLTPTHGRHLGVVTWWCVKENGSNFTTWITS